MEHWIASSVIYQVNLRGFASREPRNPVEAAAEVAAPSSIRGTHSPLQFLSRGIDSIRALGCNVIYLMPPFPTGREGRKGIGSNYSIRDFKAVDPEYGTIEELAELVSLAHARDMRIILDLTPNHTARDHVWTTAHPEYYVRDEGGNLAFDWNWSDTAKLDYGNPDLRRAMREVLQFWLDLPEAVHGGADGFRFDMAHFINDLSFWNETLPALREERPERELLFLAESYGTTTNLDLFARGMNAAYDDDFYKVCCYGYARNQDGESIVELSEAASRNADFADKFEAFKTGGIAGAFARALLNYEEAFVGRDPGCGPWLLRYTDNHDEGRGRYRFGDGAARAVNALAFLSGHGLPLLLCGQEFGAMNRPSIHDRIAACSKGYRVAGQEGQSPQGVEFEGNLFARGLEARRAWHAFYRELTALRRAHPALHVGEFKLLDVDEDAPAASHSVLAFDRVLEGEVLRCAVNLGDESRTLGRAALLDGEILYGCALENGALGPFRAVVCRPSQG